jgi:hypothetical protein
MRHFSRSEERILRALGEFQYLTTSQFVRLGISKTRNSLYPTLRGLTNSKSSSLKKIDYNANPTQGRLEAVYYLTGVGVTYLTDLGLAREDIKYPQRRAVSFASDYKHRIWTVDFFIALKNWIKSKEYGAYDFNYYFQQKGGSNRNNKGGKSLSKTRLDIETEGIGYLVPDGVFIIERDEETPLFALFEQHNGKDTKKLLGQLNAHKIAISKGTPSIKYNIKHEGDYISNRVFVSFEHEGIMQATMHRICKDTSFHPFMKHFLFSLSESVNENGLFRGWVYPNGEAWTQE